jgi:hypothetical protein
LNPESFADPLYLGSHPTLVLERVKMLNHGITKRDVEAIVVESREIGGVPSGRKDVFVQLLLGNQIQEDDLNVSTASPTAMFPELVRSANIENAKRSAELLGQGLKLAESSRAQPIRK